VPFRISDTFTDSLIRLAGDEQRSVETTAFDFAVDPANPGMQSSSESSTTSATRGWERPGRDDRADDRGV